MYHFHENTGFIYLGASAATSKTNYAIALRLPTLGRQATLLLQTVCLPSPTLGKRAAAGDVSSALLLQLIALLQTTCLPYSTLGRQATLLLQTVAEKANTRGCPGKEASCVPL